MLVEIKFITKQDEIIIHLTKYVDCNDIKDLENIAKTMIKKLFKDELDVATSFEAIGNTDPKLTYPYINPRFIKIIK